MVRVPSIPVLLALLLISSLAITNPASAFPRATLGNHCDGTDDDMTFKFTGSWSSSQKNLARGAASEWEVERELSSTTVTYNESSGTVDFEIWRGTVTGADGTTDCNNGLIKISDQLPDSKVRAVVLHEIGHSLGLHHTGRDDSFDGTTLPAMSTCLSSSNSPNRTVTQDDAGSLNRIHSFSSAESIHANPGFERGKTFWGSSSASEFYSTTSGTLDGTTHVRFRPSSAYGYIYQSMNYVVSGGSSVDARTNIKKISSSSTTGSIKLQILSRTVLYASATGCEAGTYQSGLNQNARTFSGSWVVRRTEWMYPTTSWRTKTEATVYTFPGTDLFDARVRVSSNVTYTTSGSYALISVDTTRIRDRS